MKGHKEPRTLCAMLILGAETCKAGEGYPSPREGQLSPCLLCVYHLSHSQSSTHWRPSPEHLAQGITISADTAYLLSNHLHSLHIFPAHRHCEKLSNLRDPSTIFRSWSPPLFLCLVVPAPWMEAGGCSCSRAGSSTCRSFPATPTGGEPSLMVHAPLLYCSRNNFFSPGFCSVNRFWRLVAAPAC